MSDPKDTEVTEPTQVEAPTDAPQDEAPELDTDALRKELERARKEAAKYRTRLREREEAETKAEEEKRKAEQSAEDRAKDAEKRAKEALEAAEARVQAAERKAALAGKVTHPERVLRLMDDADEYFDGTEPDEEKILSDFPEYAPKAAGPTPTKGAGGNAPTVTTNPWKRETRNLTMQARIKRDNPALAQELQAAAKE